MMNRSRTERKSHGLPMCMKLKGNLPLIALIKNQVASILDVTWRGGRRGVQMVLKVPRSISNFRGAMVAGAFQWRDKWRNSARPSGNRLCPPIQGYSLSHRSGFENEAGASKTAGRARVEPFAFGPGFGGSEPFVPAQGAWGI